MLVVLGDLNAKLSQCYDKDNSISEGISVESNCHPNCHHQIIYAKLNLEVLYPPPYTREVGHYHDSNVDLIRRSLHELDWDRASANKHVDEKVLIFN